MSSKMTVVVVCASEGWKKQSVIPSGDPRFFTGDPVKTRYLTCTSVVDARSWSTCDACASASAKWTHILYTAVVRLMAEMLVAEVIVSSYICYVYGCKASCSLTDASRTASSWKSNFIKKAFVCRKESFQRQESDNMVLAECISRLRWKTFNSYANKNASLGCCFCCIIDKIQSERTLPLQTVNR